MSRKRNTLVIASLAIIAIILIALVLIIGYLLPPTTSSTSTSVTGTVTPFPASDQPFFIQPYADKIEAVRNWFMTPFDSADQKMGYDPSFGMVRGGFWGGGFQSGFVLIDTQLILAKSLDYFNAQHGAPTTIEQTLRTWLANTTFTNPGTGQSGRYLGNDRREILFGKMPSCVMDDSGQTFYAPGHTLTDPSPVTTALTNFSSCASLNGAMNTFALWIELYYLEGNLQQAKSMFQQTLTAWTPTAGTGIGGSTGGYFGGSFGSGPGAGTGSCGHSRTLGYWIHMARATGFWNMSDQTRTIAQQAVREFWAHQAPDGGITVSYPNCGNGSKESGESSGLALVAFDPRVPQWFRSGGAISPSTASGHQAANIQKAILPDRMLPGLNLASARTLVTAKKFQPPRMGTHV